MHGRDGEFPRLVDTHCHLDVDPLGKDPAAVLGRARAAGVNTVVVPAYDLASWPAVTRLAVAHRGVHAALGLHPWVAHEDLSRARLEDALAAAGAVAVGEIGLDAQVDDADLRRQQIVLELQLEVAIAGDLPVVLHCRGAFAELLAVLGERSGLRGVLHAFSRSGDLAERFVAAGLHLGFGGAITRPRARARDAAARVPLDRTVLETDAPSIGLEGVPAKETEPRHVRDVAEALAGVRGAELDEIAEVTTANACRLFRL
ncbi:MAG: TatD family hydrolase [Candidatus Krumholzibacteriia bacterium]